VTAADQAVGVAVALLNNASVETTGAAFVEFPSLLRAGLATQPQRDGPNDSICDTRKEMGRVQRQLSFPDHDRYLSSTKFLWTLAVALGIITATARPGSPQWVS
jgi:hypothetical protein